MFVWKRFDLKGEKKDLRLVIDVKQQCVFSECIFFFLTFLTPPVGPTSDVTVNYAGVFFGFIGSLLNHLDLS